MVGELQLKRKLFGVKQLGPGNVSESTSSTDWSASSTTEPDFTRPRRIEIVKRRLTTNESRKNMSPSVSMPQLQQGQAPEVGPELIRSQTTDSQEQIEEELIEEAASGEENGVKTVNEPEERAKEGKKKNKKRLRVASRAVLFFRRAASALKSSNSSNSLSNSTGIYDNHLTGLPFQRQSTADSSTQSQVSSSRSNCHLSSLFAAGSSNGTSGRLKSSASRCSLLNHLNDNNNNQNKPTTSFVVPKMNALKMPLVCLIKSLDGELMREVFVHRYELGQHLFDSLKVSTGMEDSKFFGLKLAKSLEDQEDLRNPWLDLNESVCKQIKQLSGKGCLLFNYNTMELQQQQQQPSNEISLPKTGSGHIQPQRSSSSCSSSLRYIDFYLRIKFYPPNLTRVQDSFLRHYLWLQLRRDLSLGKLISSMNNLTLLMACVLQYEFGDYNWCFVDKIQALNILPNQDLIEGQAIELWREKLVGFRKHQAQMKFLRAAVILETYGFDYYPVRDHQRQRAYLLGFNYAGIKTIRNGRIVHHLRWHSLSKICYERRMIILHHQPTENSKRKQILGFKCLSNEDCQSLYLRLLEQKYFFTVDLAYFDKSVRRPSCLYSTATATATSQPDCQPPATSGCSSSRQPAANWPPSASQLVNGQKEKEAFEPEKQFHEEEPPSFSAAATGSEEDEEEQQRSDEQFIEEAWLKRRATSGITHLPQEEANGSYGSDRKRKQKQQLNWRKKLLGSCRPSSLANLVESVLVSTGSRNNAIVDQNIEQPENSRPTAAAAKQLLKFCLLILLMNLLFHLCDSLSTFLIGLLPAGAPTSQQPPPVGSP